MFKKLLLCIIAIAASSNVLDGAEQNKNYQPLAKQLSKNPIITSIIIGCINGLYHGFEFALPSLYFLNGSVKEKIAIPFISAILAGTVSAIFGPISLHGATEYSKALSKENQSDEIKKNLLQHHLTAITYRTVGIGTGIGMATGILASSLCYAGYTLDDLKNLVSR